LDPGETIEQAARREACEEAGVVAGALVPLGSIVYAKSRKQVHCFAGEAGDAAPQCASWEVDRAEFVPLDEARDLIHPDQRPFLERLEALVESGKPGPQA
jgi:8-oxo-dGTP pyrophosphatase MutT (NUDIX family)